MPCFEHWGTLSIGDALLAILAIDVVGVARGWKLLDHWGHLGGAAAGAAWARFGDDVWKASLKGAERMRAWEKEEAERRRKRRDRERRRRREEEQRRR